VVAHRDDRAREGGNRLPDARGRRLRELCRSAAAAFSGALEGREFLVGDSLTVADIVITGVLFVSKRAKLLTEESPPSLQAYFSRLGARPALARAAQRVESVLQPA
jgi:glutathione S-transferase